MASGGPVCPLTILKPQVALGTSSKKQHGGISTLINWNLKRPTISNISAQYLCPTKKTTILTCNMEGQCCFQNTGPKVESQWEVMNFGVFLRAKRQLSMPVKRELLKLRFCHCHLPSCFATALNTNLVYKPNEKLIPGAAFLHVNQMNLLGWS